MKYEQAGVYEIEYKTVDECGNETIVTRNIVVESTEKEIYAIFDSADNSLVFAKDKAGYSNGEVVGTKVYYTGIETDQYDAVSDYPWSEYAREITSIVAVDEIKLTTTQFAFNGYVAVENVNLEKVDMDSLTTAESMFRACVKLNDVILPKMSNITNTSQMFYSCRSLPSVDLSNLDTSNVTNMGAMFFACNVLASVDLSSFDTSNVTSMSSMFMDCHAIETLDFSNFDTSKVTNIQQMLNRCKVLKTIYATEKFNVDNANGNLMFVACDSLVGGSGTAYDSNHKGQAYARIDNPPDEPGYFTLKE